MTEQAFFAAFFFPAAAVVLVFLMKYVSAVLQARVKLGQDEAYRELATKATNACNVPLLRRDRSQCRPAR